MSIDGAKSHAGEDSIEARSKRIREVVKEGLDYSLMMEEAHHINAAQDAADHLGLAHEPLANDFVARRNMIVLDGLVERLGIDGKEAMLDPDQCAVLKSMIMAEVRRLGAEDAVAQVEQARQKAMDEFDAKRAEADASVKRSSSEVADLEEKLRAARSR